MAPVPVGHIERDQLRYHGESPFSAWGKTWERVMTRLPVEAAYALYEHAVRQVGQFPAPPLRFTTNWQNKAFRILKTEDASKSVVALYKSGNQFALIKARTETYKRWADKARTPAELAAEPPYPTED